MSVAGRLVAIWRYPVKSMMGEELNSTELAEKGVVGDRAYGLWDVEAGVLAKAKNAERWPDMFSYRARFMEEPRPWKPTPPVVITLPNGDAVASAGAEVGRRLSGAFGRPVHVRRLRGAGAAFEGASHDEQWASNEEHVSLSTSREGKFYDNGNVHIVTTATLAALQAMAPGCRLESRRFRPNLVIDVSLMAGYVEDSWVGREIAVGEVILQVTQRTKRCILTTFAQGDLPEDMSLLQAIWEHNDGFVGVYAQVVHTGAVRRGDEVYLI